MSVARGKATDFSCVTMKNMTMKGANFLEKLLDNQPVEWKKLGEVCIHLRTGLNPRNNFKLNTDDARNYYVTVRELRGTEIVYTEKTDRVNDEGLKLINNRSQLKKDDILFSATGTIGKTALITEEPKDWNIKEGVYALTIDKTLVLPKFFLRYIQSKHAIDWILQRAMGSTVVSIPMKELNKLPIPVPPLSVQSRIVEILDKFTSLEAELEAELDCRKRQYIYYRELLLDFSQHNNIQWKKLGEVCEFQNGFAFKSSLFKEKGLPIIRITNISGGRVTDEDYKYFDSSDYPKRVEEFRVSQGDILIAMSGATTGKIGWYDNEVPAYLNQRVGRFIPNSDVLNNRFLYHYLQMKGEHLYLMAGGGAQPNLSSTDIKEKFPIPLPPLSEQARIVEILDKFDTLTNSISEGLPLEIQLRRQQYEYYREQLLAFPHS